MEILAYFILEHLIEIFSYMYIHILKGHLHIFVALFVEITFIVFFLSIFQNISHIEI